MSRRSPRFALAAAALALAGSLAACAGDSKADVATDHPEWRDLSFVIGDNGGDGSEALSHVSGAFDDAPYSVSFARFDYGPPLVQAAASGDIDLGSVGDVPPITGAADELGFSVVGVHRSLHPDQAIENIIVPEDSDLDSIADLRGKKIAVPQGSSAHGLALNAIRSVGLSTDDVELVFLKPADGQSAFANGSVDAWAIWNPLSALAVQQGARVLVEGLPPLDQTSSYFVAANDSLQDPVRRAALADLLTRLAEQQAWANDHPEDYARAIAQETGLTEEDATELLPTYQRQVTAIGPEDVTAEQQLADAFFDAGEIDQRVDFATVVDDLLPADFAVG